VRNVACPRLHLLPHTGLELGVLQHHVHHQARGDEVEGGGAPEKMVDVREMERAAPTEKVGGEW
jgi:hypothetical protein